MLTFLEYFKKQKIDALHPNKPKIQHTKLKPLQGEPDLKGSTTDKATSSKNLTNRKLPRAKLPSKPKKAFVPNSDVIKKRTDTLKMFKDKTKFNTSYQKDLQGVRKQKLSIEKKRQQEFQKNNRPRP